ncbi:caspase family protein [Streptomyces californicus]|uniref:caspase family protein n=1 Tax=Streptomyces californicus TaxID=67351 RepID=UPI0033CBFE84
MTTLLPDPSRSRVVLIGAGSFEHLSKLPAVVHSTAVLGDLLRRKSVWGIPVENYYEIVDPINPSALSQPIFKAASDATDTLVIYYAGHGLTEPRNGKFYLAVRESKKDSVRDTAVPYEWIREAVESSRAARRIVIIDCCHSGRALGLQSDQVDVGLDGTYVLTATDENSHAISPPDESYTSFTGELIRLIRDGVRSEGEFLDLDLIYNEMRKGLKRKGRPLPHQFCRDRLSRTPFVRNAAHISVPTKERAPSGDTGESAPVGRIGDDATGGIGPAVALESAAAEAGGQNSLGSPPSRQVKSEAHRKTRRGVRPAYMAIGAALALAAAISVGLLLPDWKHRDGGAADEKTPARSAPSTSPTPSASQNTKAPAPPSFPPSPVSASTSEDGAPATTGAPIFEDDFTPGSNNWTKNRLGENGGTYTPSHNSYLVFSLDAAQRTYRAGFPVRAEGIYPDAPGGGNMTVAVTGRANEYATIGFGLACRARADGSGYYFTVWGRSVYIEKISPNSKGEIQRLAENLDSEQVTGDENHGQNKFLISCINSASDGSAQLTFNLNGKKVLSYTDRESVINGGSIALVAGSEPDTEKVGKAEFTRLQLW